MLGQSRAALTPPIVACFAITALAHAATYLLNALLPLYVVRLGASSTQVGLLFTVTTMTSMVLRPLVGGWNDRYGFRRVALPGALVLAVTTAALWAAGGPVSIVLLMAGIGVGNALVTTSTGVHVARISRPEHRGEALSLYYVATSVGCVVGPPLGFLLCGRASMAARVHGRPGEPAGRWASSAWSATTPARGRRRLPARAGAC